MTEKLKAAIRAIPDLDDFEAMQFLAVALVELCKEDRIHSAELHGEDFKVTVRIRKPRK